MQYDVSVSNSSLMQYDVSVSNVAIYFEKLRLKSNYKCKKTLITIIKNFVTERAGYILDTK